MSAFTENLAALPAIDHLEALELQAEEGGAPLRIENKPGQTGSLRLYHALWQRYGAIDATAAAEGLRLYAEHTADARANPGKHPNIDRLLTIISTGARYRVTPIVR